MQPTDIEDPEQLQPPFESPATTDRCEIVTIRFRHAGKQYDFATGGLPLQRGDLVVVETNRGRALGSVTQSPRSLEHKDCPADLKKVLRLATEADQNMARISASKEKEAFHYCFERIRQRTMEMKLVRAEYLFDGSKIIFYFTADGRIDFRDLVKDLAHHFHTRIEMRQIGVRDEAKLVGGIGICGRELCCGTFLTDFYPVSVKMAKQQGLALNPTKISGQCGRLLCCLSYEYPTYCQMAKKLPKAGSTLLLDGKPVKVISCQILAQSVTVSQEGVNRQIPLAQLQSAPAVETATADAAPQERSTDAPAADSSDKASRKPRTKASRKPQDRPVEASGDRPAQPSSDHDAPATAEATPASSSSRRRRGGRRGKERREGQENREARPAAPANEKKGPPDRPRPSAERSERPQNGSAVPADRPPAADASTRPPRRPNRSRRRPQNPPKPS